MIFHTDRWSLIWRWPRHFFKCNLATIFPGKMTFLFGTSKWLRCVIYASWSSHARNIFFTYLRPSAIFGHIFWTQSKLKHWSIHKKKLAKKHTQLWIYYMLMAKYMLHNVHGKMHEFPQKNWNWKTEKEIKTTGSHNVKNNGLRRMHLTALTVSWTKFENITKYKNRVSTTICSL